MEAVKKRINLSFYFKLFLIAVFIVAIIVPLLFMFVSLGTVKFGEVIASQNFLRSLLNSLLSTITATTISIVIAFLLAFVLNRSKIRFKGIFAVIFTVPMLIPSISHGMSLIVLFGSNGLITNLFHFQGDIYGFWGVVLGSVMYSFPTAFLMFYDILKYEDRSVYEAADILAVPKYRQLLNITFPYMKKALISIFFATFTLIFTDYGVAMMIGGRFVTLPLYMYNEVIGQLNFGIGAIVALVLLIPAVTACLLDIFNKDGGSSDTLRKNTVPKTNKPRDVISYVFCFLSALIILVPIFVFSVIGFIQKYPTDMHFSFSNVLLAFNMNAGQFLANSLLISLLVGLVGTIIAYVTAYFTARSKGSVNRYLHLISLMSLAVPGMVLGISYSLMYKGSFLSGTLVLLIFVNTVHFFSSPYLMCYNALGKINGNYEIIAKTLRINKFHLVKDVLLPQSFDTILEMFSYFFVNSMVTISAVSFLATIGNMPLSLLINQFETQMLIECAAFVSFLILLLNGILKVAIYLIKRWRLIHND